MDPIEKALARLTAKERNAARAVFERISWRDFKGLDRLKLKERSDIFRVRKGNLRIIYREADGNIFILAIERRSEKTYRGF